MLGSWATQLWMLPDMANAKGECDQRKNNMGNGGKGNLMGELVCINLAPNCHLNYSVPYTTTHSIRVHLITYEFVYEYLFLEQKDTSCS